MTRANFLFCEFKALSTLLRFQKIMRFVVIDNTSIDLRPHYRFDAFSTVHIRDFKIQRLGRERKRKKIKRLNKQ